MPQGQSAAVSNAIRNLITQPESGRIVLPETTRAGGGAGMGSSPTRDFRADRLGFDAPESEEALYRTLLMEVGAICGVPWSLMPGSGAAGPAIREGQRELLTGTVQPLGNLIIEEAARVLESPVTMTHHKLAAADTAGGRCQTCGCWAWSDGEAHHVDPLARGGVAVPPLAGVKWICKPCHFREHHPHSQRHAWDRLLA